MHRSSATFFQLFELPVPEGLCVINFIFAVANPANRPLVSTRRLNSHGGIILVPARRIYAAVIAASFSRVCNALPESIAALDNFTPSRIDSTFPPTHR